MTKPGHACACGLRHEERIGKHCEPVELIVHENVAICSDCLLDMPDRYVPDAFLADQDRLDKKRQAFHARLRESLGPDADVHHYRHYL